MRIQMKAEESSAGLPPPIQEEAAARRPSLLLRWLEGEGFVATLVVVCFVVAIPLAPDMASTENLSNLLSNFWPLAIIVVGQTFVLVLAGIDLSQTAVMAVTNTIGAMLVTSQLSPTQFAKSPFWGHGLGPDGGPFGHLGLAGMVLSMLAVVLAGALIGLLNGLAVARLGMPPFMVTLGSLLFFGALAVWMTKSENVTGLPNGYVQVGQGGLNRFVTGPMVMALAVAALAHFILARTAVGSWFYASGSKREVAVISGVPYTRIVIAAYVISASCAALGGMLYSMRIESGRPTLGGSLLLDVIGAAVIGGVSLFGGKGSVLGACLGALLFVVLADALSLMNLPFYVVMIIKGLVIINAALLDVTRTRILVPGR